MGYRVDTRADLVLADMDGAVVSATIGVPIAAVVAFDAAANLADEWGVFVREGAPEWNLEDAQGALPVSEHVDETRITTPVARAILRAWRTATVNPPAPLPPPSSEPEG